MNMERTKCFNVSYKVMSLCALLCVLICWSTLPSLMSISPGLELSLLLRSGGFLEALVHPLSCDQATITFRIQEHGCNI
ncbi:hypothetical protein GDO81_007235 [Engystomops pustulosus]|uniref:Uncharacterized protein n=1 Tax=Engystomops pustulosus TaxID=76066 RepID=A0AAV7C5N7_ENGPU|nr:hypothetical protein GDO81_007235 [Engystomops pustulosus]